MKIFLPFQKVCVGRRVKSKYQNSKRGQSKPAPRLEFDICNLKFSEGFTLVEIIVAMFAFTMIIYGLVALVSNILSSSNQQSNLLASTDQARKLSAAMMKEFRNAVTGSNGAYPLDTAGDQQIVFYADDTSAAGIERVRYFLQSGVLKKGITNYSGGSYNTSTEAIITVQNNVANSSSTPLFYYYNGSYIGSSTQASLAQPVNVTQVKYIKLNLQLANKAGIKNNNIYTVTAGGTIRNLKTNLGN